MKVRVGTLCSGYDSQCLAMERLKRNFPDFDYELVFWSEFDPESKRPLDKQPAVIAHNALFPQWADRNVGDMTKADWSKVGEIDLLTYSTPCTDISNAGRQAGAEKDSGTRSSIIWHTEKAIRTLRPKYLLMENVANFVSKAHIGTFKAWLALVESLGYNNFAKVLNATEFGCPQNRERIFVVSIRKDISDKFYFPQPIKLEKRFKDVLESNVDEKYYLSEKGVKYIANRLGGYCKIDGDISATLTRKGIDNWTGSFVSEPFNALNGMARTIKKQYANVGGANMCRTDAFGASGVIETALPICLNSKVDGKQPSLQDRVYSVDGASSAITTCFLPNIAEPIAVAMRGRNPENPSERGKSNGRYKQRLEPNITGCANAITSVQKDCLVAEPLISVHPFSHKLEFNPNSSVKDIAPTLRATDYKCPPCVWKPQVMQVGNIYPDTDKFKNRTVGRVYDAAGIAPTINTCGGGREPKIVEGEITSNNLLELVQAGLVRIRKITPREAFRLMDIEEEYIDVLMSCGVANTGMYQLAGNSIVVGCLYHIFRKMFCETENENDQLTLF